MRVYNLADFDTVPSAKELVTNTIDLGELPSIDEVRLKAKWSDSMLELFEVSPDDIGQLKDSTGFDRSSALSRMAYSAAEQQWDNEQILAVLIELDDRWGKYVNRRDREHRYLIPMIDRAREKVGYTGMLDIDIRGLVEGKGSASAEFSEQPDVYGFQDFVEADFPIDWQVKGLLAKQGIVLVTGYPGTGKTQLTIQMGAYLALGHDKFLKWETAQAGSKKVLFLSLEMAKPSLNHFMKTIGESYEDKRTLNHHFKLLPHGQPLHLDKAHGQNYLTALLDEHMPDVLIIDSLQKSVSKEMTDELAMKSFFEYVAKIRAKYRCSMVFVHHMRKAPNENAKKKDIELSDMYGSTFIAAEVDAVIALRKESKNVLSVSTLKNRLAQEEDVFDMVRDQRMHFSLDFDNIQAQYGQDTDDGPNLGL